MSKVFNYLRISTRGQNEQRQLDAMEKWNKENNVTNPYVLIDKATGTNTNREKLQMMLTFLDEGDLVVIKSIDRLSRNYGECKKLWQEIVDKGADIVVIDMPLLDTRQYRDKLGNFISDLILTVLGYVADQENQFRKQRQTEGIASMPVVDGKKVSKKTGRAIGRPTIEKPSNWNEVYKQWTNKEITGKEAMELTGLKRNSFYKLVKTEQ